MKKTRFRSGAEDKETRLAKLIGLLPDLPVGTRYKVDPFYGERPPYISESETQPKEKQPKKPKKYPN